MFKHPENTMAVNPKTLDFSRLSEFLVATTVGPDEPSVNPSMKMPPLFAGQLGAGGGVEQVMPSSRAQ
jgi:hypothetical protein